MKDTQITIENAISDGEIITIIYNGGSQPGKSRQISPISIKESFVQARQIPSMQVKTFSLDKIKIISPDVKTTYIEGGNIEPENLADGIAQYLSEIQNLGWHIKINENGIDLFRSFKNGKLRKQSDFSLEFNEFLYDYVYDFDTELEYEIKKTNSKPWQVTSLENIRHFKYLSRALDAFIHAIRLQVKNDK